MTKPLSNDIRERVITAVDGGMSLRAAGHCLAGSAASHGSRTAMEAVSAELRYLSPCSPDLNPIEMAFAKFKAHLKKAAARTVPRLLRAIKSALLTFKPQRCRNLFKVASYGIN